MSHTPSPIVLSSLGFEDLEFVLPISIIFELAVFCSTLWLIGALGGGFVHLRWAEKYEFH